MQLFLKVRPVSEKENLVQEEVSTLISNSTFNLTAESFSVLFLSESQPAAKGSLLVSEMTYSLQRHQTINLSTQKEQANHDQILPVKF